MTFCVIRHGHHLHYTHHERKNLTHHQRHQIHKSRKPGNYLFPCRFTHISPDIHHWSHPQRWRNEYMQTKSRRYPFRNPTNDWLEDRYQIIPDLPPKRYIPPMSQGNFNHRPTKHSQPQDTRIDHRQAKSCSPYHSTSQVLPKPTAWSTPENSEIWPTNPKRIPKRWPQTLDPHVKKG